MDNTVAALTMLLSCCPMPTAAGNKPNTQDFAKNGHQWTEALCKQDSDGDGKTNGQELGDPDCKVREGGGSSCVVAIIRSVIHCLP